MIPRWTNAVTGFGEQKSSSLRKIQNFCTFWLFRSQLSPIYKKSFQKKCHWMILYNCRNVNYDLDVRNSAGCFQKTEFDYQDIRIYNFWYFHHQLVLKETEVRFSIQKITCPIFCSGTDPSCTCQLFRAKYLDNEGPSTGRKMSFLACMEEVQSAVLEEKGNRD